MGCATTASTNPLTFAMLVRKPRKLFAYGSSIYCLLQLPSRRCCSVIIVDCFHACLSVLLLLSGGIEANPDRDEIFAELVETSAGKGILITEKELVSTNNTISQSSKIISKNIMKTFFSTKSRTRNVKR